MKVKTSELQGAALDWAVAKAEGFVPFTDGISWIIDDAGCFKQLPKYSADWAQGGPIIEREGMHIDCMRQSEKPIWEGWPYSTGTKHIQQGPTPLIAAMRCYVASKLGDEIELPEGIA